MTELFTYCDPIDYYFYDNFYDNFLGRDAAHR